jgi:UDP-glucuronate 4-epimerase
MTTLITGAASFIGAAVCEQLLARGEQMVGIDNLNPYYDPALKQARLQRLEALAAASPGRWQFHQLDIADGAAMAELFAAVRPLRVIHLAAQAGVRYSLENPAAYVQSSLVGMGHVLEGNRNLPFQELQPGDVEATAADTTALEAWVGFRPATPLAEGVERFATWYCTYVGSAVSTL